ncbi:nuclease-related domain-containing protein [Streptomyces sp. NPDC017940]|uniref:nuclease-related domain-containing protein n=1 Tax=Streptomyces sp. NPDC017940 TaxID=3365017 RepID=UPI00378AF24D
MTPPSPTERGAAGASAQARADELRREERRFQHRRAARWMLPALLAWWITAQFSAIFFPGLSAYLFATAVPYFLLRRFYTTSPEVARWQRGARGEQRTARILRPLTRRAGWVVLHDRALPGTRANLDHLALVPDGRGAVYIDTKTTRGGGVVALRGDVLHIGKTAYRDAVKTVRFEAAQASKVLGVPVHPVIAVHGATVPHGRIRHTDLLVVSARSLRAALASIPHNRDPDAVRALATKAATDLPPYTQR